MNRREVLALLAAAACGPARRPRGRGAGSGSSSGTVPSRDAGVIVDDWSNARASQLQPSPLAVRGNHLAYRMADELAFLDATTLARIDSVSVGYRSLCALPDGTLAAFEARAGGACQIDIFDGAHLARSLVVPACVSTRDGARLAAGADAELFVLRGRDSLLRYRVVKGALVEAGVRSLDERALAGVDQLVGLGDGRVVLPAGDSLQLYGAGEPTTRDAVGRPAHLALGTKGRIWYSVWGDDRRIERVVLAQPDGGRASMVEATVSIAPGRITHMAASPSGALALLVSAAGATSLTWTLVVLDAHGVERKRVRIEDDVVAKVGLDLALAFVALTEHRVVVAAGRHGVFAWDVATGARVR